jgi:hypothetical protein
MILAVVGSRSWIDNGLIDRRLKEIWPSEIVTGGAAGVDMIAEAWGILHAIPVKVFYPDWSLGRKAGPLRNQKIVNYCDELVAFWDGKSKGTLSSIELAKKAGKLRMVYIE